MTLAIVMLSLVVGNAVMLVKLAGQLRRAHKRTDEALALAGQFRDLHADAVRLAEDALQTAHQWKQIATGGQPPTGGQQ